MRKSRTLVLCSLIAFALSSLTLSSCWEEQHPGTYYTYTGQDDFLVKRNLDFIARHKMQDKVLIRLPLIKDYNDEQDRQKSMASLQAMGFTNFDLFTYKTPKQ